MTRNELNTYLAAILTTLAELDTDTTESIVYLALGMDMERYETVRNVLLAAKLVTINGNRIALTAAGRELADKCNAALAAKR